MQIFCFVYLLDNVCVLNLNLLQVLGRSDLFLRLEIIKKSISVGMLFMCCAVRSNGYMHYEIDLCPDCCIYKYLLYWEII